MKLFKSKDEKEQEKQARLELYGKKISSATGKYIGGSLPLSPNEDYSIDCHEKGVVFHPTIDLFSHKRDKFIPYDHLQPASFKTEEQISKDVTLGRLLTLGVFAFAFKKKKVTRQQYLIVSHDEYSGVFLLSFGDYIVPHINTAREKYLSPSPRPF